MGGENITDPAEVVRELARMNPIAYGQARKAAAKALSIPVGILDKEVVRARRLPISLNGIAADLICTDNGLIMPIFANAAHIIRSHREDWPLSFDEFGQRPFLGAHPLVDGDLQKLAEWVQHKGVVAPRATIDDAALHVANEFRFHEVRDWLTSLEWDGTPRLDRLLIDHAGAEESDIHKAFTARWLIQAVARIYEPGCQADATLLLEGPQDLGKSSLFRALFGNRWFSDHLPSLDNKDAMIQLLGIWCIEISELATTRRADNEKTKQFLTSRDDRFRMPFARLAEQHPRQSVFAATNNPSGKGALTDETGARRWWPIAVTRMDISYITRNRDQIWAEATFRYKDGEHWHITEGALLEAAKAAQTARYSGDVWDDEIAEHIKGLDFVTLPNILINCLGFYKKSDWKQGDENRVSRALRHFGWKRRQHRLGDPEDDGAVNSGDPKWGYQRPDTNPKTEVSPVRLETGDISGYRLKP